jgi:hypothetical protein
MTNCASHIATQKTAHGKKAGRTDKSYSYPASTSDPLIYSHITEKSFE